MKLKYPVPVSEFAHFVPHRPPMVWIDEVLSASPERGECRIVLKKDALYWSDDRFSATSCIEWVAQGFAFVRSAYLIEQGVGESSKALEAMLVGIRNAQFSFDPAEPDVQTAKELRVFVHNFREFGPIISLSGEVRLLNGRVLMKSDLRVYHGVEH